MEKDCTDELMECTTQCDTHDKECHEECVEEYHECDISKEFTADDDNNVLLMVLTTKIVLTTW